MPASMAILFEWYDEEGDCISTDFIQAVPRR